MEQRAHLLLSGGSGREDGTGAGPGVGYGVPVCREFSYQDSSGAQQEPAEPGLGCQSSEAAPVCRGRVPVLEPRHPAPRATLWGLVPTEQLQVLGSCPRPVLSSTGNVYVLQVSGAPRLADSLWSSLLLLRLWCVSSSQHGSPTRRCIVLPSLALDLCRAHLKEMVSRATVGDLPSCSTALGGAPGSPAGVLFLWDQMNS